ncbi:MAG: hypothetical protein L6R40_002043 [Gallowayella cf. fulva]|nr:MAG: hypothetical protein L6R40_002043 [Xanthomendoza cf. fulva]
MADWNTGDSWSGGAAVAGSSSWNAGAGPAASWDDRPKNSSGPSFDTNGLPNAAVEANGGLEEPTDNAGGGADDRACRICNETGHLARECPQKPEGFGKCFNCGEEGQYSRGLAVFALRKATRPVNAPKSRLQSAVTASKKVSGILSPSAGHMLSECTNNKVFDLSNLPDMSEDDAWDNVIKKAQEAAETRELDEFREALKTYQKAVKEINYAQLERSFRTHELGIFIIAVEPREGEILDTHTLIDLSGKKDCKYKVGYFFKKTPRTGKLAEVWPASEEENLARLEDAGVPYERGIPKCLRCKGETTYE